MFYSPYLLLISSVGPYRLAILLTDTSWTLFQAHSVSAPPSSEQLSGGSATLACLLSRYSPQGAMVSWEVDGAEVKEGVLTTTEEEKGGRYSRSSTLTLSKARWEEGEVYTCRVAHDDISDSAAFRKSHCSV
uniref:Ig-like domain-containing protein n=1 Tax=Hucho hucho TaxID=62062 RepID=A0A4W5MBG7_9TELE